MLQLTIKAERNTFHNVIFVIIPSAVTQIFSDQGRLTVIIISSLTRWIEYSLHTGSLQNNGHPR